MTEQIKDIESALKKVKDQKENFGFMERFTVDENWEVTKALEKQIPKKPIGNSCPTCGADFCSESWERDYCCLCGQKLDWGDEDDRADEQLQSIEDAKMQATEYLNALDKAKKKHIGKAQGSLQSGFAKSIAE